MAPRESATTTRWKHWRFIPDFSFLAEPSAVARDPRGYLRLTDYAFVMLATSSIPRYRTRFCNNQQNCISTINSPTFEINELCGTIVVRFITLGRTRTRMSSRIATADRSITPHLALVMVQ